MITIKEKSKAIKRRDSKIIGGLLIAAALVLGTIVYKMFRDMDAEFVPSTYVIPPDQLSLISKKHQNKIRGVEVHNSKSRGPISVFQMNEFHLAIYKINLSSNDKLYNVLQDELRKFGQSSYTAYSNIYIDRSCTFSYKSGKVDTASKVFLALSGNSVRTLVSNDSIRTYHLDANNVSIRYGEDASRDILITPGISLSSIPMELLIFKKNKAMYLVILYPDDVPDDFSDFSLYDLIAKDE